MSSARGQAMAKARWDRDRQRRNAIAAAGPALAPNRIVRRIVVIDGETTVREAVIWEWDSAAEARRKVKAVLASPTPIDRPRPRP